jgi:hypothetical protein
VCLPSARTEEGVSTLIGNAIRWAALAVLLVLPLGCSDSSAPTAPAPRPEPPPAAPRPAGFPPILDPARVYTSAAPLNYPLQPYTLGSRFVLSANGTFALQYGGTLQYRGTYKEENGVVTFEWEGWSTAGPWGATGSLDGKTLTVRFNLVMQMSDFEDAIYTLTE